MKPALLLYSDFDSPRLRYILNWIFREQLGIIFDLTTDYIVWNNFEGAKINYSTDRYANEGGLQIIPHNILREADIRTQQLSVNRWKHSTILFYNQPGSKVPFDLFAAAFYLLSRYEEYLPHEKDRHGRYEPQQSVASQYSFIQQPVVDEWIFHFRKILEQQFQLQLPEKQFRFIPTYDIDIAWKYLHKGSKRSLGGLIKDIASFKWASASERIAVNTGKKKDPFDCFEWLDSIHEKYQVQPIYFMLLGQAGSFDKNADPHTKAMQHLMETLGRQYSMGIHPSYGSHKNAEILKSEIEILESSIQKPITKSRQHYIKFSLPETYERLIEAGIQEDYSMGYASCNGFRAGTSNSFLWYNLNKEAEADLRVHPFAFMEATNKFYLKQKPESTWMEWERLWYAIKKTNGTFISIWHNYILGTDNASKGWRELYLKGLEQL